MYLPFRFVFARAEIDFAKKYSRRIGVRTRRLEARAITAAFLFLIANEGRTQSPLDDGFNPDANGEIKAVAVQPDGKVLIGGSFTKLMSLSLPSITRNRIARLNADGSIDPSFDPNANGDVQSIAVQADGKILVGGFFNGANSIGGQARNRIARLDPVTGLADSFDPSANDAVLAITIQQDGNILVGGNFSGVNSIGGETRNHIARLDLVTGVAEPFDPNANGVVSSIVLQPDGAILAAGNFSSIGGQMRNGIARLDVVTGVADSFNPNANTVSVNTIALQPDNKILVGGAFTSIGGQARNRIARLDGSTGQPDAFNPNADGVVSSIVLQPDGKIFVAGNFSNIGGQTRTRLARLDPVTGLADQLNPMPNDQISSMAMQADGKILIGGLFTILGPSGGPFTFRNRIARLETDGRVDRTLSLNVSFGSGFGTVYAIAVQPDNRIVVGGAFTSVNGISRNNIARLYADGSVDMAFNPNVNSSGGNVFSIVILPDGKILAGGEFANIGGQLRNSIARLDGTTGSADSFDPNASGTLFPAVVSIAVQDDGKFLAGGSFTSIGGQPRNDLARLDPSSGLADLFDPNANNIVFAITPQMDGKILTGGDFTTLGGATRNRIARLDLATGMADSFDPNANSSVYAIVTQTDGKLLTAGNFNGANSIGGQARNRIARLDPMTGLADSFNPNANGGITSLVVQTDSKIVTSGQFTQIGGLARNRVARLDSATGLADSRDLSANGNYNVYSLAMQTDGKILAGGNIATTGQFGVYFVRYGNDIAALQSSNVTQTTVTWTRGGSSPLLTRATFEYSPDNVNYTPLGNGTAVGTNWSLTGLSLPTGTNIYIRARGFYRSGRNDGSESITESIRNAFIVEPTPTATPTPSPTPSFVNIAGIVLYCPNPVPNPVANVTVSLTGSATNSTSTDDVGNYLLSSLPAGGSYTVTPTKPPRTPGAMGINTVDVLATQRHFLGISLLTGCRLTAGDVNGDNAVTTVDVIAIQRFFLGNPTGIANVGKYQFNPANRSYSAITSDQTGQNYDTLVFGDVASAFVE